MEETTEIRGSQGREVLAGEADGAQSADRGFIILVARNNLHLTKKAVASALAQDTPCDVLLIDNASSDGTAQWAATKHLCRISLATQISLAECWNIGLQCAWLAGRGHALVLNNDVEIRVDAYRLLLAHGGPFVTCVSVDTRERMGTENDRGAADFVPREHPDFSSFLIRKEVTERVGWFDEDCFPAYTEDSRYHVSMWRHGIRAVCIDVPFLHHGASTLKYCDPAEASKIRRGADRNREKFKQMYGCYPGEQPGYGALFSEASFGMYQVVAGNAKSIQAVDL